MIPITKQSILYFMTLMWIYTMLKNLIYIGAHHIIINIQILLKSRVNYLFNGAFTDISSVKLFSNGNNRATFDSDLLFNGNIRWDENDSYWGTDNETKKHDGYNSIVNNVSYHYFILLSN